MLDYDAAAAQSCLDAWSEITCDDLNEGNMPSDCDNVCEEVEDEEATEEEAEESTEE